MVENTEHNVQKVSRGELISIREYLKFIFDDQQKMTNYSLKKENDIYYVVGKNFDSTFNVIDSNKLVVNSNIIGIVNYKYNDKMFYYINRIDSFELKKDMLNDMKKFILYKSTKQQQFFETEKRIVEELSGIMKEQKKEYVVSNGYAKKLRKISNKNK